ncbi:MAG: hypothetical protein H5T86_16460, partial [Armatimonadetes bacterium]|nr:hypothetical protein [Armatimonadota bacterium]
MARPTILLATVGLAAAVGLPASAARFAAEKFIPTYAIKYGAFNKGIQSADETAKFDLLIVSTTSAAARVWARDGKNSWHALKTLNPD